MKASFRLGRIGGIEIGVHYTLLLAVALFGWLLATSFFPDNYPDWSAPTYWVAGVGSALLLFVSVLVHELAHSFVARGRGMPVMGITLFMFGGASNLGEEPRRARDEFIMAAVGPLTSLILSGLLWGILFAGIVPEDGPVEGILVYLALVNGALALFNILPGFPLDGGRVLRSILWGATGSLVKATNMAAGVGQLLGWAMIGLGAFMAVQGSLFTGLWMVFIGWFLSGAASNSRKQAAIQVEVRGVKVQDVMEPDPLVVSPGTTVAELVDEQLLGQGKAAVPVCLGRNLVGIVTLADTKRAPKDRWPFTPVEEIMTGEPLHSVGPEEDLARALRLMGEHNINQVLVEEDYRLVGLLTRAHVIRYLQRDASTKELPR